MSELNFRTGPETAAATYPIPSSCEQAADPGPVRPSGARLRKLESFRKPTLAELEEMEFLRSQVAWAQAGGPGWKEPPRLLCPLPKA